ncbi:DUF1801 domain-containing protein [Actinocorallia sp. A-T 12471]|uniref:iron chaperone n=1 Tax=Actinocorallia sp. A-T 12471 TaxID=3089813 RepID=UPI0029CD5D56|nr:DUF1801 domain-containing protein [Actinocorallia sp. A-T 12471]MDX6741412.1 DUF1801 domain-containing protein [Actinocorallia sp. A-T 12471]
MVQSSAATVAAYVAEVPEARREAIERIRALCLAELPGFTEEMSYGMPAYAREHGAEIAFAAQKRYISFYLLRTDVRAAFADRLAPHDVGKACLRFTTPAKIDYPLLRDLLRATAAAPGIPCLADPSGPKSGGGALRPPPGCAAWTRCSQGCARSCGGRRNSREAATSSGRRHTGSGCGLRCPRPTSRRSSARTGCACRSPTARSSPSSGTGARDPTTGCCRWPTPQA